ncbi:phage tail protein [Maribellus sp. CM-23]|uniref:phage tail protein n=1 Tax=Maribellus sp. CM-23 TaxID=2781026 RepID=UPI001F22229A|nr:phage tail protein [Maribellus sp. CM-23]MCE4564714.1 phage tail protein [Maribellus sp. CM-23]
MGSDSFFQTDYAPPTAFYFSVKFDGFSEMDASFQEVSGLKVTLDTIPKKEGGDNHFVHHLPVQPKYENLVLKRCLLANSGLDDWCRKAIEDFKFSPKDITLSLLGSDGTPLASWRIMRAYPISWELGTLNSTSNQLAIESITLKYRQFKKYA